MQNFEQEIQFNNEMLEIVDNARLRFIPIMLSKTSKFLYEFVKKNKPKNILEIGTAIGYSGLVMMNADKNCNLTTIEFNKERAIEAENNFKNFKCENRVKVMNMDGLEALKNLKQEEKKFDLVFLDGPKGQYMKYFEIISNLLTKNATVIVDDILFNYNIYKENKIPHKHRAMISKLRNFVDNMISNEKYVVEIYNLDEGIMTIREK